VTDSRTTELDFDAEALHRRYLEERDKRLRPDGLGQYQATLGEFKAYREDPYTPKDFSRDPLTDEVDVVIVGGGFSGLIAAGRMRQAGVESLRVIEGGADFGGTWYWNRYPGVRCDVESYIYMPFLEEVSYIPTEKYAGGAEIYAHVQRIARHFDLYSNAALSTLVTSIEWDEDAGRWIIRTNRNDEMKARFVCLAGGILHRPKLPGIPGISDYKGHSFHTSRWDYEYTGGDTNGGLTNLRGKRVGIIGTGATAIQCVPHLAQYADELYVFQRTPSTVDERNNKPTDPAWAASLEQGWQKKRRQNFTSIVLGIPQDEDLVNDRWTDVWGKLWSVPANTAEGVDPADVMQMADYMKMNEIRGRIDSIVTNKDAAESLKPWYNLFCKRPGYSDEFLQVFNQPNVHLIDTQGQGVDRITEKGIVSQGTEYELDCIIYATGFNTVLPPFLAGDYEVIGRDGRTLGDHWAEEVKSVHGLMTRGFPNLFIHGHTWGATLTVNVPHALGEQSAHVAAIVARCLKDGVRTAEVSSAAEDAWHETILANQIDRTKFLSECTPGYFNDEGQKKGPMHRTFPGSPILYMELLDKWRVERMDKDLEFTYE
jgi:cation diffusion facilitator CzcD-associated flavoprotein CzcO